MKNNTNRELQRSLFADAESNAAALEEQSAEEAAAGLRARMSGIEPTKQAAVGVFIPEAPAKKPPWFEALGLFKAYIRAEGYVVNLTCETMGGRRRAAEYQQKILPVSHRIAAIQKEMKSILSSGDPSGVPADLVIEQTRLVNQYQDIEIAHMLRETVISITGPDGETVLQRHQRMADESLLNAVQELPSSLMTMIKMGGNMLLQVGLDSGN